MRFGVISGRNGLFGASLFHFPTIFFVLQPTSTNFVVKQDNTHCFMNKLLSLLAIALCLFTSCGKTIYDEAEEEQGKVDYDKSNLIISVTPKGLSPMDTRAVGDESLSNYFDTINFVVYKDGKKVKAITQPASGPSFGTAGFTLSSGTYQLLVLAHSSSSNPVLSDPAKLYFSNEDGYSDTFYHYGDVTVTEQKQTVDIELERATSLLQFVVTDEIPANVDYLWIKLTGGSGTLDATTGYGCVNSIQVITPKIDHSQKPPYTFSIYTFLKKNSDVVTIMVKPRDANNRITDSRFQDFTREVPMVRGRISILKGNFFTDPSESGGSGDDGTGDDPQSDTEGDMNFNVTFDPSWDDPFEYEF